MILVKKHQDGILAICDADLIGKKFEHDLLQLDVTERFYKGDEMETEDILRLAEDADCINIVGDESIDFALKNNLIEKEHIIYIADIPHAQVFKIK
jgi:hypothetical protein